MTTLKQSLAILSICFITNCAMAQTTEGVSIKSTLSPPHPSAMLDVESASKGILIPRVPLVTPNVATPVTTPAVGLLVYNTTNSSGMPDGEGFYFWDASGRWQKLESSGNTSGYWSATATGNSIHRGSIATQLTDGSTLVGIQDLPAGCQSEFYVNGPSTFFAADPGVTSISATAGIQIGAPWSPIDGGHWNEINTPDFWLDMQFNTGQGVNIGAGGKGSNLNVLGGTNMPGNIYCSGVLTTSDSTKKKNITTCSSSVLTKLNTCKTYEYNFKGESDSHKKHTGVLAQEIEAQFPTLVENQVQIVSGGNKFSSTPVTITTKAVDYAGLTAVLLQALKEQQAQIEALKARVTVLENH
jgi:hypothetical protein